MPHSEQNDKFGNVGTYSVLFLILEYSPSQRITAGNGKMTSFSFFHRGDSHPGSDDTSSLCCESIKNTKGGVQLSHSGSTLLRGWNCDNIERYISIPTAHDSAGMCY